MNKKNILIVDDEMHILELLKYNLEQNNYNVVEALDGEEALNIIKSDSYEFDAILLDLMMPKVDGLDVIKELRGSKKYKNLPIIMLTAKGEEFDKVMGLEIGADDYLAKPFSIRELMARIKALLRRSNKDDNLEDEENILSFSSIKINFDSRTVFKGDVEIKMSLKEFELLKILVTHPNRVYSRDLLLEKIWGYDYFGETRTVDVHIRNLRKKIEDDTSEPKFIKTVIGVGYKFSLYKDS